MSRRVLPWPAPAVLVAALAALVVLASTSRRAAAAPVRSAKHYETEILKTQQEITRLQNEIRFDIGVWILTKGVKLPRIIDCIDKVRDNDVKSALDLERKVELVWFDQNTYLPRMRSLYARDHPRQYKRFMESQTVGAFLRRQAQIRRLVQRQGPGTCRPRARGAPARSPRAGGAPALRAIAISTGGQGGGTITSRPAGIACTYSGGSRRGPCSASFPVGTTVAMSVTPSVGSVFAGWAANGPPSSFAGCDGPGVCTVLLGQSRVGLLARFDLQLLTLSVTNPGATGLITATGHDQRIQCGGIAGTVCEAGILYGTRVLIGLTPQDPATLVTGVTGCTPNQTLPVRAAATCTVTVTQPVTVGATFG